MMYLFDTLYVSYLHNDAIIQISIHIYKPI